MRLAHGWQLRAVPGVPASLTKEFVRPAVRAVPCSLVRRLGQCRIRLLPELEDPTAASRWTRTEAGYDIEVATEDVEAHDVGMELLLCLGQACLETLSEAEGDAYMAILQDEFRTGVTGEIDEDVIRVKHKLAKGGRTGFARRMAEYVAASFAATLAEYIHCLWHDVTVRTGPTHLPPDCLRRRLELLARWFPANRGYRLLPE